MKKFKIIEEKNPVTGEVSHYELWWHKPSFWNKDRWVCQQEHAFRCSYNKRFNTKWEIITYIEQNYIPKVRTEICEGVVDGNLGIQRSDGVKQ